MICTASDQCHVAGTCNPANGQCSNPPAANGTACNDSDACTQTDTCQTGVCTGGNPVVCTASDQCHVAGTCNPANGQCSNPPAANGTACNDSDACTQTDTCQTGVCTGSNPVVCTALDQCHVAGTCNPASGQCSNPPAPAGTACGSQASSDCDNADTCDGGGACQPNYVAAGTSCSDGLACTLSDVCNGSGACAGTPKDCTSTSTCAAGTCQEPTGTCVYATSGACNIAGTIDYYRNSSTSTEPSTKPVPGEGVQRVSSIKGTATAFTNASGQYSFTNEGGNTTLTPQGLLMTSESECRSAITSADASMIAKSAVFLLTLTPNQKVAGDVSLNGLVTAYDAALVAQKSVATACLGYSFPARLATGSDWAFRPVSKTFTPLMGGENYDFLGILYGDVTGNWIAPALFAAPAAAGDDEVSAPTTGITPVGPVASTEAAVLYLVSGPVRNSAGSYEVVLGIQNSDGIIGLDMGLHYDPATIRIQGVTALGIGSTMTIAGNTIGQELMLALYGPDPLRGAGSFLKVTYDMLTPASGLPFSVSIQANEGQIPVAFNPGVPRSGMGTAPGVSVQN